MFLMSASHTTPTSSPSRPTPAGTSQSVLTPASTSSEDVTDDVATGSRRADRARLTAVLLIVGALSQVPLALLHPHQEHPNDSRAAFAEYAKSTDWVWVHLGQFVGTLLITLGLLTAASALTRRRGAVGQLARLASMAAIVTTAVFAVQMAVDGIALKAAIDRWVSSSGAARAAAFDVADSVRSIEKGLSALFHLNNGITLLALGVAMLACTGYGRGQRLLGGVGAAAGIGFLVESAVTARTGFSAVAGTVGLAPTLLLLIFLIGTAITMWRQPTYDGARWAA